MFFQVEKALRVVRKAFFNKYKILIISILIIFHQ